MVFPDESGILFSVVIRIARCPSGFPSLGTLFASLPLSVIRTCEYGWICLWNLEREERECTKKKF